MRGITFSKHKDYKDDAKVYVLDFSQEAKTILKRSNVFTRKLIIPVIFNFLKQDMPKLKEIKINWARNLSWHENVNELCFQKRFAYKAKGNQYLVEAIDLAEEYWLNLKNNETNELNPKIKDSYINLYADSLVLYDNIKEVLYDMNRMFDYIEKNC